MSNITYGHEVYFESAIVGLDEKGVVYIRSTGLDGSVRHIRLKPSDVRNIGLHIASREANPFQGQTVKRKPEPEVVDQDFWDEVALEVTKVKERVRTRVVEVVSVPSVVAERVRRRD